MYNAGFHCFSKEHQPSSSISGWPAPAPTQSGVHDENNPLTNAIACRYDWINRKNDTPRTRRDYSHKQETTGAEDESHQRKFLIKELIRLAKIRPLKPAQVDRAKMLMAELKLMGCRNKEISYAVKGSWSESTIKLYTRGVASRSSKGVVAVKSNLSNLLKSLIQQGITTEDIMITLAQKKYMDSKNSIP